MSNTRKMLVATIGVIAAAAVALVLIAPWEGKSRPEATFTTLEGEQVSLDSLRGQPVLVTFWATDCPTCIDEIPHLQALHDEMAERGVTVVGVAMHYDDPELIEAIVEAREMSYLIAHDSDRSISQAFGEVRVTPTSYLVDPDGKVVWQRLGLLDMDRVRGQIERMLERS
ncbi:peroxiredoxin [Alkalispirillum mobile]|uniref:Peroxiredoxin n=1 Tax=Alkalispirillum mobile TaxID=85925 RepID=A0A498CDE8_9GAMM|nr:TlpA disulfide reductase family protein [Alkalispirillum mobile]RLK51310.1 peroxiredoxin [Alkalispirillum mobile]